MYFTVKNRRPLRMDITQISAQATAILIMRIFESPFGLKLFVTCTAVGKQWPMGIQYCSLETLTGNEYCVLTRCNNFVKV